jgi:glycerophosphoryl diester phosphodiesterase
MTNQPSLPELIAHRGYAQCYPENTLCGLEAALRAGARYIEFDVQFTRDAVPVVFHDTELERVTGVKGDIRRTTAQDLGRLHAQERERFGQQFAHEPIPTLSAVLDLLGQWPATQAFVEIKAETVEHFGEAAVVQALMAQLRSRQDQCVLISFHREVLQAARAAGMRRIGWAMHEWGDEALQEARSFSPDVLFCNYKKLPDRENALWPGPWQWALYDIVDPDIALYWANRGAHFIETWDIGALLRDPRLANRDVADRADA